jgi:FtsH-binding integral membrane protein
MHSVYVSFLVFLLVFAGSIAGICLRRILPDEHFSPDAKATIRLSMGFVVTMTGLVLGMLVSSAKSSYDAQKLVVAQMSSELILLDRDLKEFGPDASMIRVQLREYVDAVVHRVWPQEAFTSVELRPQDNVDKVEEQIKTLTPKNERQSSTKAHALALLGELRQATWLAFIQSDSNSLSMPLLVVLVSWLVVIFVSFGLMAPPNPTVIITLLIGSLAVSGAILIIMEMYSPFSGILRISSAPMQDALSRLNH